MCCGSAIDTVVDVEILIVVSLDYLPSFRPVESYLWALVLNLIVAPRSDQAFINSVKTDHTAKEGRGLISWLRNGKKFQIDSHYAYKREWGIKG